MIHLFSVLAYAPHTRGPREPADSLLGFRARLALYLHFLHLFITKEFRLNFPTTEDQRVKKGKRTREIEKRASTSFAEEAALCYNKEENNFSSSRAGSHFPSTFPLKTGSEIIPAIIRGAGAVHALCILGVWVRAAGSSERIVTASRGKETGKRKRDGGHGVGLRKEAASESNANSNKGLVSAVRWGHYTLYCAWRGRYARLVRTKFRAQCERCVFGR